MALTKKQRAILPALALTGALMLSACETPKNSSHIDEESGVIYQSTIGDDGARYETSYAFENAEARLRWGEKVLYFNGDGECSIAIDDDYKTDLIVSATEGLANKIGISRDALYENYGITEKLIRKDYSFRGGKLTWSFNGDRCPAGYYQSEVVIDVKNCIKTVRGYLNDDLISEKTEIIGYAPIDNDNIRFIFTAYDSNGNIVTSTYEFINNTFLIE